MINVTMIKAFLTVSMIVGNLIDVYPFGFPRRISDYPVLFSRFHRLNPFGLVGVALPMFFLLFSPMFFLLLILATITLTFPLHNVILSSFFNYAFVEPIGCHSEDTLFLNN